MSLMNCIFMLSLISYLRYKYKWKKMFSEKCFSHHLTYKLNSYTHELLLNVQGAAKKSKPLSYFSNF